MPEWLIDYWPLMLVVLVSTVLWFTLRVRSTPMESATAIDPLLSGARPAILHFFKNT
jgi:hypothetical protein